MKAKLIAALLLVLFLAGPSQCFALMEIAEVSKERAKEMGVTLRSRPNGDAGVAVWIEFRAAGALKNFTRVELRMTSGGKHLMSASLLASRTEDKVEAYFSADPDQLAGSTLLIAVTDAPRTHIGYEFRVKDFVEAGAKKAAAAAMPRYITAAQIKAMPPATATVEHKETFTARLRTADGKQFTLGSDRGEQDVWHFVGTALKVGQTYELPGAFLDYQQRKFYVTAEELKAMPPVKATLELRGPCFSIFRATDGKQFVIGDPGSKREVRQFLGALKEGQTYEFPNAFLDHQKK
jgi:hypothetical protein